MRKTGIFRRLCQKALPTLLLAAACMLSFAQNVGEYYHDVTDKEWNFQIFANTTGFGGGFQHGRTPDLYN
jgi:hypothetical protein